MFNTLEGFRADTNELASLPDGVFGDLAALNDLRLSGNPGTAGFLPAAVAAAAPSGIPVGGGDVMLDATGSSGGPWGGNVKYRWALTDPSGVTLTWSPDAQSATTTATVAGPLAVDTPLTFTLTVDGLGGDYPDTATASVDVHSTDATLNALTVNDGTSDLTLDPAFVSGTYTYAASAGNAVTSVTLTATASHSGGSVTGVTLGGIAIADTIFTDGIEVPSLAVGANVIVVTVTAEDTTTTQDYTVTVTRAAATDATLSTLSVNDGTNNLTLDPAFASGTYTYEADVANAVTSVTVTATPNHAKGAVTGLSLNGITIADADFTDGTTVPGLVEGANEINVEVAAENTAHTQTYTVTVTRAMGNNAPEFATATATREVAENTAAGQNIGAVVAATDDDGDTLTYTLEGTDAASFDIVSTSGQIQTKTGVTYDHEAKSSYSVTVKADDSNGGTDTIAVTISITDVDEPPAAPAAPTVSATSGSTTSLDVSWAAPTNTGPAITGYDLRYRQGTSGAWTDGPEDVTGTSTSIGSLTAGTSHEVQVRATNDEGDGGWSAAGTGSTNTPANNAPVFATDTATREVAENTAAGENVGDAVTATDDDVGDTLTYTLEGADAASFDIGSSSGQIQTKTGVTYDHEAKASYSVTVKADDGTASDTIAVTINITDVDEPPAAPAAPTVTATSGSSTSLDVSWTAPTNTGKPAITGYDLRYREGTSGAWTAGPAGVTGTSTSIGSLTPSTSHEVQVRATNDEGDSGWSASGTGSTGAAASTDATLSALALQDPSDNSAIALNETFAADTLTYTAGVASTVEQITVLPATADDGATVEYLDGADNVLTDAGSGTGFQVDYAIGGADTVVKVKVTAEDTTTTQTYTLTVKRIITVGYDPVSYSLDEGEGPVVLTVFVLSHGLIGTPQAFTLNVNTGDGTAVAGSDYTAVSQTITFNVGEVSKTHNITLTTDQVKETDETFQSTITVASGDVTIRAGTATVTILDNDDATLSALALENPADSSAISLNETFASDTLTYTADVASTVEQITIAPTTGDGDATFAFLDADDDPLTDAVSGGDFQVDLEEGANTIKVKVTAVDTRVTQTYTLTVTREEAIIVGFGPVTYSASEFSGTVDVTARLIKPSSGGAPRPFTIALSTGGGTATAGVDYVSKTDEPVFFPAGVTSVNSELRLNADTEHEADETIQLILERVTGTGSGVTIDPATATFTILDNDDATLSALTVNDGTNDLTLDPVFASGTDTYEADVANAVTSVTLTATPNDSDASVSAVTLGGTAIADTDFTDGIAVPSLSVGDNVIVVTVTAEDTNATQTYTLTVTRAAGTNNAATGKPSITGTAQVGRVLEAGLGTIADGNGLPASFPRDYTIQWVRVDADGSSNPTDVGTNSHRYRLVSADQGKKIRVKVSFTDAAGNAEGPRESDASGAVTAAPANCPADADWCAVMTVGTQTAGTLTTYGFSNADFDGYGAIDDTTIDGGPGYAINEITWLDGSSSFNAYFYTDAFLPLDSKITLGTTELTVDAVASQGGTKGQHRWIVSGGLGWSEDQEVTVGVQFGNFPATGKPTIAGTPKVDATLSADVSAIEDHDGLSSPGWTYQWFQVDADGVSNKTEISGATSSSYTLTSAEGGKRVIVEVSFTDNANNSEGPLTSAATAEVTERPALSFDDINVQAFENEGTAQVTVNLAPASTETVTVDYATRDNTAISGEHYTGKSGTLSFAPGVTSQTIDIEIFDNDIYQRRTAFRFNVELSNPVNADLPAGLAQVNLRDDDDPPTASIEDVTVAEDAGTMTLTLELSHTSLDDVVFDFEPRNVEGTATSGADYAISFDSQDEARVRVRGGDTQGTLDITVNEDNLVEGEETITINLTIDSEPTDVTPNSLTFTGTILDNDAPASTTLSALTLENAADNSAISFAPAFASGTTLYTANVGEAVDEITILATTTETGATVEYLDGDDTALTDSSTATGFQVELEPGANTVKVKVTAADNNASQVYVLMVRRTVVGEVLLDETLTVRQYGDDGVYGCSSTSDSPCSTQMTEREFESFDAEGESIVLRISGLVLALTGTEAHGNLSITFMPEGGDLETANRMRDHEIENLALEIDGRLFCFRDAHRGLYRVRTWNGSGTNLDEVDGLGNPASKGTYGLPDLDWSNGQPVQVRILNTCPASGGQQEAAPFTAEFQGLPPAHDGESPFAFRIAFSEDAAIGYEDMRDHALEVTGATVTGARRVDGQSDLWELTLQPSGTGEITIRAPHDRACTEEGALCTADGRSLAAAPAALILGPPPGALQQAPLTAVFADVPGEHDGQTAFELRLTLSKEVAVGYATLRDHGFEVAGGTVTGVRRTEPGSNAGWWITVRPDTSGAVTVTLPVRGCAETGAVCTSEGEALAGPVTASVAGPAALPPLTASFEEVPAEHDGSSPFQVRLSFSAPIGISWVTLRDEAVTATGATVTGVRRVDGRSDLWELTVEPSGTGEVTLTLAATAACGEPGAVCTSDGRALANAPSVTVAGPPGLSVADAEVEEAAGAVLAFAVTLSRPSSGTVTVAYATSDGTATAGADYTAASDTLTFAVGETQKTVSVAVLDDSHDEGSETLTLVLSNPSGAYLADGEATGTITNSDHMPQAWLARFGRTVADQVLDAVEDRMTAPRAPGASLTIAGQRIGGGASPDVEALEARESEAGLEALSDWLRGEAGDERPALGSRELTGRDLLTGTSFALAGGTAEGGFGALWGRGAVTRFDGREGELDLDGDVASALVGADFKRGRSAAGLVLSHSRGEGEYRSPDGSGEVESTLTGLYPWGRYEASERLSVWGVAGYGAGTLTLTPEAHEPMETDLDLAMGAVGARGVLVKAPAEGGLELAAKSDALVVRTSSEEVREDGMSLEASEADVTRLRLGLEGTFRGIATQGGGRFEPGFELGVRHDGGDAERGFGADIGAGLAWTDPSRGIEAELRARGLLTHEAGGFRERGFAGAFAWDPAPSTERGPSFALRQTVGASASGGMDALLGPESARVLGAADDDGDELERRALEAKLGYGFAAFGERFTSTPSLGLSLTDTHRETVLGLRLAEARTGGLVFGLDVEGARRESAAGDDEPEHRLGLGFGWRLEGAGPERFALRFEGVRVDAANADGPEHRLGVKLTARW